MAYLRYTENDTKYEVELNEGDTTIGRAEECDLQLLHDPELSRIHCSVQMTAPGVYVLVDEAARNGTFLNAKRVLNEEVVLKHKDRITIGQTDLIFREEEMTKPDEPAPTEEDEKEPPPGRTCALFNEIAGEMDKGKGFKTLMREIVKKKR